MTKNTLKNMAYYACMGIGVSSAVIVVLVVVSFFE